MGTIGDDFFRGTQGMRNATNAAAVSAMGDVALRDGELVYVATFRDYFVLYKSATDTVNGTTVLATLSGTGRWMRVVGFHHPSWSAQATWYIDPVNGNEENTGLVGAPIKSDEERVRRRDPFINRVIDVYLLGDVPLVNLGGLTMGSSALVRVHGTRTTVISGTLTGVTAIAAATNTPMSIVDTSVATFTPYLNMRIRITSGARVGAVAWIAKATAANTARISPFVLYSTAQPVGGLGGATLVTPVAGDPYVIESLTNVADLIVSYTMSTNPAVNTSCVNLTFEDLTLTAASNLLTSSNAIGPFPGTVIFLACDARNIGDAGSYLTLVGCHATHVTAISPCQMSLQACLISGGLPTITLGVQLQADLSTLFMARVRVRRGGLFSVGTAAVFDSPSQGVIIEPGAMLRVATALYGSGNGTMGLTIRGATLAHCAVAAGMTITGASGDFQLANVAPATGVRVFDDTTGAWSAAKVPTTWANFVAARPGGFAANAIDPVSGAALVLDI